MNMIPVDSAISRVRRDMVIGTVLRGILFAAALAAMFAGPIWGSSSLGLVGLVAVGAIWMMLSYRSMAGTRMAADSPMLIASGDFDKAETQIDSALKSFSLFKTGKLLSLHHLAVLRHAQKRWAESAQLCQAILGQTMRNLPGLARTTLLIMTDSLLQSGDLRGAQVGLNGLNGYRLTLSESLSLQLIQLEFGSRTGNWEQMLSGVGMKVQMCELMSGANAAKAQELLAKAARQTGREQLADWLQRRAELLSSGTT
jgi:hypothetical protein